MKRVSDPSANMSVTVRLLIHTSLASLSGFRRVISATGDVLYDLVHFVWLFPSPNIPVDVWKAQKKIRRCLLRIFYKHLAVYAWYNTVKTKITSKISFFRGLINFDLLIPTCQNESRFSPQLYETRNFPSGEKARAVIEAPWAVISYKTIRSFDV